MRPARLPTAASIPAPPRARARGFSLIELLVVLTIAGILLAIGVPSLQSYFVSSRLATFTSDFQTALNLARSEAIRRGARVVIARTGSTSQNYGEGWRMFVDLNGNGTFEDTATPPAEPDIELRQSAPLAPGMTLYANSAAADRIVFDPQGRITSSGAVVFMICYDGVNVTEEGRPRARALLVAPTGRIRMASYDSQNRPLNDAGTPAAITSCTNPT